MLNRTEYSQIYQAMKVIRGDINYNKSYKEILDFETEILIK